MKRVGNELEALAVRAVNAMSVHYFTINYANEGEKYLLGIDAQSQEEVQKYLSQYSIDVIYVRSKEARGKRDNGVRKCEIGTIVYCKHIPRKQMH